MFFFGKYFAKYYIYQYQRKPFSFIEPLGKFIFICSSERSYFLSIVNGEGDIFQNKEIALKFMTND